jgi:hypothetical protein
MLVLANGVPFLFGESAINLVIGGHDCVFAFLGRTT